MIFLTVMSWMSKKTAHLCLLVFLCVAAVFAHPQLARGKDPEIYQAEAMISQGTDSRIHFQLCNYTTGVQSPTTLWSHMQKEFRCRISAQQPHGVWKKLIRTIFPTSIQGLWGMQEWKNSQTLGNSYYIYIYIVIHLLTHINTRGLWDSRFTQRWARRKKSAYDPADIRVSSCVFVVWRRFQRINHTAAALRHLF